MQNASKWSARNVEMKSGMPLLPSTSAYASCNTVYRHIGLCDKEIIRPLEVGKQKVVILILSVDNPNHTHHQ